MPTLSVPTRACATARRASASVCLGTMVPPVTVPPVLVSELRPTLRLARVFPVTSNLPSRRACAAPSSVGPTTALSRISALSMAPARVSPSLPPWMVTTVTISGITTYPWHASAILATAAQTVPSANASMESILSTLTMSPLESLIPPSRSRLPATPSFQASTHSSFTTRTGRITSPMLSLLMVPESLAVTIIATTSLPPSRLFPTASCLTSSARRLSSTPIVASSIL
mmetsp:Transcript_35558/g.77149  ORF Transcript_35558/g.77149 Transcript_35558/m.77149 type:complete len:228 (-) Transcript_35558:693-1376(-)